MSFERDLADLKDLLSRADLLQNWGQGVAYSVPGGTRIDFQARISIRGAAHAKPAGVEFSDAAVELELEIHDNENGLDAIKVCSAQVVVDGINDDGEIVRFALHFDRHDPAHTSIDLHSRFHWQVGGDRLEGQTFGTVLHLQGPRFPSHPIDPVLLVDFVLGHFHGAERAKLLASPNLVRYRRILHAAQVSFVAPFFAAVNDALLAGPLEETAYWPSLCVNG